MKTETHRPSLLRNFLLALMAFTLSCGGTETQGAYSGVVEATTVDQAFEVGGLLQEITVQEGQAVEKGALLARLKDDRLRAEAEAARGRLDAARARLANLKAGARPAEIAQARQRAEQARADLQLFSNGATAEELEASRQSAEAAHQRSLQLEHGYRSEDVDAARAAVQAASANLKTQERDYQRYLRLEKEGAVSAQQFEQRRNAYDQAVAAERQARDNLLKLSRGPRSEERQAARAEYEAAEARYRNLAQGSRPEQIARARAVLAEREQALLLILEGARPQEIKAAQGQVAEAEAQLKAAETQLSRTRVSADASGIVLSTNNYEPGENVPPGATVVSIAELSRPWVTIYLPETDLTRVKLGQRARVTADGLPKPLEGKLVRIYEKAEFTPKFIQTKTERVHLVFKAKVEVDNPELLLRPGLPADVELLP